MHFVAALDKVEGMRCVLALFEVTGAADGYWRMLTAGGDAPAFGARARQWPGQFAQCQESQFRNRQHCWGACLLSHQVRRAAHRGYRGYCTAGLALGEDVYRGTHGRR